MRRPQAVGHHTRGAQGASHGHRGGDQQVVLPSRQQDDHFPKHPGASLWSSEVVTLGVRLRLKGPIIEASSAG